MAWWTIPIGVALGIAVGAMGGGGSILTIPVLVYLVGQSPAAATTGSLVIVGLTSLTGMVPHLRAGSVRVGKAVTFGALGIVGAFAGSLASARVPGHVLLTAFAALLLIVATLMLKRRRHQMRVGSNGAQHHTTPAPRPLAVVAAATGVGLLTGFFGVGGGFAIVPALMLVLGMSMPVAVGTSLLVVVINSLTALASRGHGLARLDWPVIALFSIAAMAGSLIGAWLSTKTDHNTLTLAFAILLYAVALYTAVMNVPAFF